MSGAGVEHLDWRDLPHAPATGTLVGPLDGVPDGGGQLYTFGPGAAPFRMLVLRTGAEVFAYVNRCQHFGVPLAIKLEHLPLKAHVSVSCNVHYARFRWRDGYCEFGDCAGESLLAVPVQVSAGEIRIAAGDPSAPLPDTGGKSPVGSG